MFFARFFFGSLKMTRRPPSVDVFPGRLVALVRVRSSHCRHGRCRREPEMYFGTGRPVSVAMTSARVCLSKRTETLINSRENHTRTRTHTQSFAGENRIFFSPTKANGTGALLSPFQRKSTRWEDFSCCALGRIKSPHRC